MTDSFLTTTSEIATIPEETVSRTEQMPVYTDEIAEPVPAAEEEVERTCVALVAACEDTTEEGFRLYVEMHKAAVMKHGDEAIAQTMKKYRKPKCCPASKTAETGYNGVYLTNSLRYTK
jgi:hypothetical protein